MEHPVLSPALAQRIVDRTMERLGHNVNVMDADGVIIGTGDPARRGTVHEGALIAIHGSRTVEVDEEMAERLSGVRPGVNVPLLTGGQVVGVIGVSGDPTGLRDLVELLRMTAELMVEQAGALEEEQRRSTELEALALALVDRHATADDVRARGASVGVDTDVPRRAVVVVPAPEMESEAAGSAVHAARRALHRGGLDVLTATLDADRLLVLVRRDVATADLLRAVGPTRTRVRLVDGGRFGAGLAGDDLAASLESAVDALRAGGPDVGGWEADPFVAAVAGWRDATGGAWRADAARAAWDAVATDPDLAATVLALVERDGDLLATAEQLRVHRNTLRHRLERVAALSGADVREPRGAAALVVGAVLAGELCMRTAEVT